jgi:hypothetical protein
MLNATVDWGQTYQTMAKRLDVKYNKSARFQVRHYYHPHPSALLPPMLTPAVIAQKLEDNAISSDASLVEHSSCACDHHWLGLVLTNAGRAGLLPPDDNRLRVARERRNSNLPRIRLGLQYIFAVFVPDDDLSGFNHEAGVDSAKLFRLCNRMLELMKHCGEGKEEMRRYQCRYLVTKVTSYMLGPAIH